MPLLKIQGEILSLISANRNARSFVAGATPLNQRGLRTSEDIDVFHDRSESLIETADADAALLSSHGYRIEWQRKHAEVCTATVSDGEQKTRLDWVVDSDFRFFPPVSDPRFGYVLHPIDIATNKVLAAAGSREPRDAVDLVTIHEQFFPLRIVVWAAVAKDPGWNPESLIAEIRRNVRYQDYDLAGLDMAQPLSAADLSRKLRSALNDAEAFVLQMPSKAAGRIFFDENNRIVSPDPQRLDHYRAHGASRGGHLPSSPDLLSAMLQTFEGKSLYDRDVSDLK